MAARKIKVKACDEMREFDEDCDPPFMTPQQYKLQAMNEDIPNAVERAERILSEIKSSIPVELYEELRWSIAEINCAVSNCREIDKNTNKGGREQNQETWAIAMKIISEYSFAHQTSNRLKFPSAQFLEGELYKINLEREGQKLPLLRSVSLRNCSYILKQLVD